MKVSTREFIKLNPVLFDEKKRKMEQVHFFCNRLSILKRISITVFGFKLNRIIFACFLLSCAMHNVSAQQDEPITPLSLASDINVSKAKLGKMLFFEKKLSKDNTLSCASCHDLTASFGTDLKSVSIGINGQSGSRNSPTVYNSSFNFVQFWDGRAEDLAKQALIPIVNPVEMGMSSVVDALNKIKNTDKYKQLFGDLYGGVFSEENLGDALAEFEKTLVTLNSPFDKYLRGNESAISEQQKKGYKLFKAYGCISCHQGQNVGGNMYQKLGVLKNISLQHGTLGNDLGRFNVTGNQWDKRVFKVPSLRLAAVTPPYFHDGSVATLEEAVKVMIDYQLGREVPQADKQAIIDFLNSLVGEIPKGVSP